MAEAMGVRRHVVLTVDLAQFGGSALTAAIAVPKDRPADEMPTASRSPTCRRATRCCCRWRWPMPRWSARPTSSWASTPSTTAAIPTAGRSSWRPSSAMANLATKAGVEGRLRFTIHAPLMQLGKAEIIRRGIELGVDYGLTHSCYDPSPAGAGLRPLRCLPTAAQRLRRGRAEGPGGVPGGLGIGNSGISGCSSRTPHLEAAVHIR